MADLRLRIQLGVDALRALDSLKITRDQLIVDDLIRWYLRHRTGQMHHGMRRNRLRFVPTVRAPLGQKMAAKEARWTSRS